VSLAGLGQGRARHLLIFLLSRMPLAAALAGSTFAIDRMLGRLPLLRSVKHLLLTTLREKLIKIGAKVVTHSRHVIFQMAEVAVQRELFAAIVERIQRFCTPPPLVQRG